MDKKTYTVGVLTITATMLATALLVTPTRADPVGTVLRDRDYTVITASVQSGGDALYVMDNKRGLVAVFTYDNGARSLRLRAAEPVTNVFAALANPNPANPQPAPARPANANPAPARPANPR